MKDRNKLRVVAAAVALTIAGAAPASSHREAPFITNLPKVDASDFYMFNSYEAGRTGYVTLIANYLPLQEPYGGPNYFQLDPQALSLLYVRSSTGQLVPLAAVANLTTGVGPLSINHQGQMPAVTISFNLRPGVPLSQAVSDIDRLTHGRLPASITTSFQGTAQAFQSSQ